MELVRPARLNTGDLIGIVSPASPIADPSRIDRGVRYLEGLGYRVGMGIEAPLYLGIFIRPTKAVKRLQVGGDPIEIGHFDDKEAAKF